MSIASLDFMGLMVTFFLVALLYSSVGFGGGSSYLALLALVVTSFYIIRSTALVCNLVVVSGSSLVYFRLGHLNLKRCVPFLITSVPMAFLGAIFKLEEHVFFILLGLSLILAAIALVVQTQKLKSNIGTKKYPDWYAYLIGGGVGLLSGLVGIGGGIFLAPVLNFIKWDKPLQIAALASVFILVNSISGLTGLVVGGTFEVFWPEVGILMAAVFVGGQVGVRMALSKISPKGIRLFTAVLVFLVGFRVLLNHGFQIYPFS